MILCVRNKQKLDELEDNLSSTTKVITLEFDVRNHQEVSKKISSLDNSWNKIELLINNAGNAHGLDFIYEGDIEDLVIMIDTNVYGFLYVKKYVLDSMIKNNSGHIINIGSIAGKEVYPKGNIYCASKFAVDAISQCMRFDLYTYNMKVSQFHPGLVETNFSMVRFKNDKNRSKSVYEGLNPLIGDDIAKVISFIVNCPDNVNISDLTVLAKSQASSTVLNRK